MGIELELTVLLALVTVGTSVFAVFEVETAPWRKLLKWSVLYLLTVGLYVAVGHWALALPVAAGIAGSLFHLTWCRRHGIHPFEASPRERYYRLRGWRWPPP